MVSTCLHVSFKVIAEVNRLTNEDIPQGAILPAVRYMVDLHVWCTDCDQAFEWVGPDVGVSTTRPTVSVDGTELRAPIRPKDWGAHVFEKSRSTVDPGSFFRP